MQKIDNLPISGLVKFYKNGKLVQESKNLIVNMGKNWVVKRIKGLSSNIGFIGVGLDATEPTIQDTSLIDEIFRSPIIAANNNILNNAITYTTTLLPGIGTGSIQEVGLFVDSSGGDMIARINMNFVKNDLDTLRITWTITIG